MSASNRIVALILFAVLGLPIGRACGPWFPRQYLAQGGMSLLETPRFFTEIELKLLAREYPVPFRAVHDEFPRARAFERDAREFDAAIAAGKILPPDPEAAKRAHLRMPRVIEQYATLTKAERDALPAGVLDDARQSVFPSEFGDYHEGVLAYSCGEHAEARAAWVRLLARPEGERHYRSVQAAFMIGVLGFVENWDDAPRWFALARELAGRGFHDAAGLAAASYLRESQWHHARGELRDAAECALRSISAGYPARECFGPADDSPEELANFAADPLLRRIHSSNLLARLTNAYNAGDRHQQRLDAWLRAIEAAHVREFPGAERIAWLCYGMGDYAAAARWLARAPRNSTHTLWLRGKLAARDGRRADALRDLSAATRLLVQEQEPSLEVTLVEFDKQTPGQAMLADHGTAAISVAEFRGALDAFLQAGHWIDAAFVAERLMSVAELRKYLDSRKRDSASRHFRVSSDDEAGADVSIIEGTESLRWLLGRRLAREGRFVEARPYFPEAWRVALDRYAHALARGNSKSLSRENRALALWAAALEARCHGMELLGTETAPDWFARGGNFEEDDPAEYRLGQAVITANRYSDRETALPLPAVLKAGSAERARLAASAASPAIRFHYRYRACDLAWRAAMLLPDNDPRLADMLNLAGRWIAARDPQAADRFYQALESRCADTELGKRATARRWFVDMAEFAVAHEPEPVVADDHADSTE